MRQVSAALAVWLLLALAPRPGLARTGAGDARPGRHAAWRSIQSEHFRVYFPAGLDSLAWRVLDLAGEADGMLARRLGHALDHRIPIILDGAYGGSSPGAPTVEAEPPLGVFRERFQNALAVPFTGSYEDLRHAVVHELAHAFLLDLLYEGSAARLLSRASFSSLPPWFSEGLAEYLAVGARPESDVILRDGVVEGGLRPLGLVSGALAYAEGRSAVGYLAERYGEDRLRELVRALARTRSFERAFRRAVGVGEKKFEEEWREWLRREYWPSAARERGPAAFGRRLTDHLRDGSALNTAPAVSPQGDRIAYFSDRRDFTDVYVMSASDGKLLRRVTRGQRGTLFESLPSLRSSLTWSPDGSRLALAVRSGGRDWLGIVSAESGRLLRRFDLGCDALAYPAWSPVADTLVVAGVRGGRSDLWLVDARSGATRRLTDDDWDEIEPCWTPDGRTITFASDRPAPVTLAAEPAASGFGGYGLFDLDPATGAITPRLRPVGGARSPAWSPDGRKLAFVTERDGAPNIVLDDTGAGTFTLITDALAGVSSLSWSRQDDRLVYSAFDHGGYDIFAVREPLSVDAVLARLRRERPQAVLSPDSLLAGAGEAASRDSAAGASSEPVSPEPARAGAGDDSTATGAGPAALAREPRAPFRLPDSLRAQRAQPYRVRFVPEEAGLGVLGGPGYGFAGSAELAFRDLLDEHAIEARAEVFGGSADETNGLVVYRYLPRRLDLRAGLFHLKDVYASGVGSAAEALASPRLYSVPAAGALVGASLPLDHSRRLDLDVVQMFLRLATGLPGEPLPARSASSPTLSLVEDAALWGRTGPANGTRYRLTYAPSFPWLAHGLAYQTVMFDGRRYWDLSRGYTLATRLLAGRSDGRDAQSFAVGGFSTLRGYPDYDRAGTRMAIVNAELRFPFVERLGVVGPLPLGGLDLRGAVFADAGAVWNRGEPLRLTTVVDGKRRLDTPLVGFGFGARTRIAPLVLKLDAAWHADVGGVGGPRWEFSVGPEF